MYLVTASKNMKQKLGGEVERFTIIFGDFIIPFLVADKISSRKISRDIENLNNSINQFDLIDIYCYNVTCSNSRI